MKLFHKHKKKLILETVSDSGDLIETFRWFICLGCTKRLHTLDASGVFFQADHAKEDWKKQWTYHPRLEEYKKFLIK